jgi:hypothetical protein
MVPNIDFNITLCRKYKSSSLLIQFFEHGVLPSLLHFKEVQFHGKDMDKMVGTFVSFRAVSERQLCSIALMDKSPV